MDYSDTKLSENSKGAWIFTFRSSLETIYLKVAQLDGFSVGLTAPSCTGFALNTYHDASVTSQGVNSFG